MAEHADFFDLTLTSAAEAELSVLVLTQPADETQKAAYYDQLIDDLNDCPAKPSSL